MKKNPEGKKNQHPTHQKRKKAKPKSLLVIPLYVLRGKGRCADLRKGEEEVLSQKRRR